jgi:hypothetical protein
MTKKEKEKVIIPLLFVLAAALMVSLFPERPIPNTSIRKEVRGCNKIWMPTFDSRS